MGSRFDWLRWVAGALVVVAGGGFYLWREFDDLRHQVSGYSFSETLPKVIRAEGGDARVVSVLARDRNVKFTVLSGDGRVHERYYGQVCSSSAKGQNCAYRGTEDDHAASARERRQAGVRLDQLDKGVVDRVRREAGTGKEVPIGLRGRRWVVGSYDAKVAAVANLDGSGLHRAASPADRALAQSVASDSGR